MLRTRHFDPEVGKRASWGPQEGPLDQHPREHLCPHGPLSAFDLLLFHVHHLATLKPIEWLPEAEPFLTFFLFPPLFGNILPKFHTIGQMCSVFFFKRIFLLDKIKLLWCIVRISAQCCT
jgi:hypothetical protein